MKGNLRHQTKVQHPDCAKMEYVTKSGAHRGNQRDVSAISRAILWKRSDPQTKEGFIHCGTEEKTR